MALVPVRVLGMARVLAPVRVLGMARVLHLESIQLAYQPPPPPLVTGLEISSFILLNNLSAKVFKEHFS